MARLICRKLALMMVLIPVLNLLGFGYAAQVMGSYGFRFDASGSGAIRYIEEYAAPSFLPAYAAYLQALFRGNFGSVAHQPVTTLLREPLINSLLLLTLALLVALPLGLALGFVSISRRSARVSASATVLLTAGSSLPSYFFGALTIVLVIYIFRHVYPPIRELIPWQGYGLDGHLVLLVLALAVWPVFYLARVTAGLLEHELQQDYIRTARSKGLPWRGLLFRQALPPIASPVFTSIGRALRMLVSQLVVVEALFNWPGLGRMFLATLGIRTDGGQPTPFYGSPETLAALAVIFSFLLLSIDLLTSILAYWYDPRLRRSGIGL